MVGRSNDLGRGASMSSYNEQMQALAKDYQFATGSVTYTLKDVGAWAIKEGKWEAGRDILLRQFCDDMGRALREEYIRDPQGRRVRANHVIRGEGETGFLWAEIYTAPREHMVIAFDQRRDQIVADCAQLKQDIDSYNQNQNSGAPVQLRLDFARDVVEYELARKKTR
jgi:hypothetical protein